MAALDDEYREGRPARISIETHHELIQLACTRPDGDKVPFEQVWTLDGLADALSLVIESGGDEVEAWLIAARRRRF